MAGTDFLEGVRIGEIRAIYDQKGRVWGVVRTPTGRHVLKVGEGLEEGTAYTSLSEPRNPVEREVLAWGFRHLLEEARVRPRLENWTPPGALFEVYIAPESEYLVAYWKDGERDFLEVWDGPWTRYLLERAKEPQAWWQRYEELMRLPHERLDLVLRRLKPSRTSGGHRGYYLIP